VYGKRAEFGDAAKAWDEIVRRLRNASYAVDNIVSIRNVKIPIHKRAFTSDACVGPGDSGYDSFETEYGSETEGLAKIPRIGDLTLFTNES